MRTRRSKSKPYRVDVGNGNLHEVSAHKWHEQVRNGWLVPVLIFDDLLGESRPSRRIAMPRVGVNAWLEDGKLHFQDRASGQGAWIECSWRRIERTAIYRQNGTSLSPEELRREIQRQYVTI